MTKKPKITKPTREQQFKKLQLLVEQLHKHCEKAGFQYYLCHEAPNHQVLVAGRSSSELMVNVACDLGLNYPDAIMRSRDILQKLKNPVKAKEEESKIILLR
jgi:hypothetical protein